MTSAESPEYVAGYQAAQEIAIQQAQLKNAARTALDEARASRDEWRQRFMAMADENKRLRERLVELGQQAYLATYDELKP